jgi:uncharacterized damage-inducible protein DinB
VRLANPIKTIQEIISALEAFPDELARVIDGADEPDALVRPASDGGWGVVEILPHLRDWEEIYFERITKLLEEDQPYLPGYDDALWSIERDYRGQDPVETFESLRELRDRTVEVLRSLPESAWARHGEHGYFGDVTLHWLANHVVEHDQEHLQQIRDALAA